MIASVRRTGRLLVAAEDRAFAGFVRAIQGAVVEALPGTPTRALGQRNLPAISQSVHLEDHQILTAAQIVDAARAVLTTEVGGVRRVVQAPHRAWIG